jgi:hypothetical protein
MLAPNHLNKNPADPFRFPGQQSIVPPRSPPYQSALGTYYQHVPHVNDIIIHWITDIFAEAFLAGRSFAQKTGER